MSDDLKFVVGDRVKFKNPETFLCLMTDAWQSAFHPTKFDHYAIHEIDAVKGDDSCQLVHFKGLPEGAWVHARDLVSTWAR